VPISWLIKDLGLNIKKIAIEKDLKIIHPEQFDKIFLENNNKIEIVYFIGGG
jgi:thiamine biosynthesis protein ThiS